MKVLMTTDTLGGVWTYCIELCAALAPYGIDVGLATMGRALSTEQRHQVESLPHVTLFESEYRLCWMQDAWPDVEAAGDWLLSLEQQFQPDLVQLNDLAHGGLPWQSPVLLVAHSCVYSWWEAVCKRLPPDDDWHRYHQVVSDSVQQADLVAAPSRAMLDALLRHYLPAQTSSSAPKSCVIYNGRDFPALANDIPRPDSATCTKEPIIFAAGRIWDPAKNVGILSHIVHKLPWQVVAAGEQADPNGGSQNPDAIQCLGFLTEEEMENWLTRASIFVSPAHYEPFGLSILEAARAGCALVIADIPSLREVWGEAAAYIDPNDPEQIFEVLNHLALNADSRMQMAEKAWQRSKRYSAPRMATEYVRVYQQLQDAAGRCLPHKSVSGVRS